MDYAKITGVLLFVIIGLVTAILQLTKVINILTNLTDIYIWIAAAVIGLAFGLIVRNRNQSKNGSQEVNKTEKAQSTQFYACREELPKLGEFLSDAKQEIWFIGVSNEKLIGQSADAFRKALMRGVSTKFLFLAPESTISGKWDEEMISATRKATEAAIDRLCKIKKTLQESEKAKLEIWLYDLIPFNSFIVLDPRTSDAKIQVDLYLYNTEAELRPSIIISKKEQENLYMRYFQSFEFIMKNCKKYECPSAR
jgi:hypothetical protein